MSPSTATLQGGSCIGRLAEQSPLTGHGPKSLIEVNREHTPTILPSRRGSLDTNVDDLATTLDAFEGCDTTDVGRLTSPLFSQEPGRCLLFSDTSKHGDIQARCCAVFKLREAVVER